MTAKSAIIDMLGGREVLLPGLISDALTANDRIKQRLSLLQEAVARAREPLRNGTARQHASGLDVEISAGALDEARLLGQEALFLPGVATLLAALKTDMSVMLAPLITAGQAGDFPARLAALDSALAAEGTDEIALSRIAALTGTSRRGEEKFHPLVMELHKVLNQLAAATAAETLDGAKAHGLNDEDRQALRAFMRGLHRTEKLLFGHPGLGTNAVRGTEYLTIQNDIGTTDAHVLIVHVTAREVSVTYTDIHRPRAKFFMEMFARQELQWSPLAQRQASGLEEDSFYLVTGRFAFTDIVVRDKFLDFLASRIVFLIDWNKARKALQIFVGKSAAIALLTWAAVQDYGHRAFVELGGAELVYEAVHRAAAGRIRYGERLDAALGTAECEEFLRRVLRETALGLMAGRSARLIRDEVQAELARRFETAESAVFTLLVRHLGLTRCLAEGIETALTAPDTAFAHRAKSMEAKADRLTASAREQVARRMQGSAMLRLVIDTVENTTDTLEDCAHLLSLVPGTTCMTLLAKLAGIVTNAVSAMVRAVEAASRLPEGQRADAAAALQAIDEAVNAERAADLAQRGALATLLGAPCADARTLVLDLEMAKALESATDQLSHAAFALRDRVREELSA
ncbi:hypothetical protein [Acidocella aminolytica]|nr:hypothetical protein [Acidocella aminolytica]SHF26043.1 hypothetical protein SAMN02746095_02625 [Acidocella aminolytica 101 = DSM 11237]